MSDETKGRHLAIGDIHGCLNALNALLDLVEPEPADKVVVLGDVVDRGPDSQGTIDRLIRLQQEVPFVGILGNHDDMCLENIDQGYENPHWLSCGGQATLDSYGGDLSSVPTNHITFLQGFRDYCETESNIFVHAAVDPDVSMPDQTFPWLRWTSLNGPELPRPHVSGKRVVCGHTVQLSGAPLVLPGYVCIDTWAFGGKWLTCLDATNNLVWHANNEREIGGPYRLTDIAEQFDSL